MKKILMTFILCLSVLFSNAQIATENSKLTDNIGIGITGGLTTPMDLNPMFPLNTNVGLKVQKNFTPEFGLQLEGITILNDNHFSDIKTAFKATNVGLNGIWNLTNIFKGYKGSPRWFEIGLVGGLGWFREFDTRANYLTSKTALDFYLNLGKGHSLVLTPAIYWNLDKLDRIQFNRVNSQLALNLSYMYFLKNSNGTHAFKTYDIMAMQNEINYLNDELSRKPKEVYKEVVRAELIMDTIKIEVPVQKEWFIQFAKNSPVITDEAKAILDKVKGNVRVVATSSPEGNDTYNKALSERRAAAVTDYLMKRKVNVLSYEGKGAINEATNRIAVITRE